MARARDLKRLVPIAGALTALGAAVCPAPSVAQSVGTVEGRVQLEAPPPPRRSANRYPGGATETHSVQTLPPVVYLEGAISGGSSPGQPDEVAMTQRDTMFIPSVVFVRPGGSVSFPNDDPFQHNVYSYSSAMTFDLGRQNPGTSEARTFPTAGIVEVFCEVHDFMRGAIVVTESPFAAVVAADGSFRISGVPPGEYTVAFWHAGYQRLEQVVSVPAGGIATVEVRLQR